jgi:hypothetical protein
MKSINTILLLIITITGAWLRFYKFSYYGLNYDEGIYFAVAWQGGWLATWGETYTQAHPPLFYFLLKFCQGLIGSDIHLLRLVTIIPGIICIPLIYIVVLSCFGSIAALIAALLYCTSPAAILCAQLLRPYQIAQLMLLAGFISAGNLTLYPVKKRKILTLLFFSLAILFLYGSIIFVGGYIVVLFYQELKKHGFKIALQSSYQFFFPLLLIIELLLFTHILPVVLLGRFNDAIETWLSPLYAKDPIQFIMLHFAQLNFLSDSTLGIWLAVFAISSIYYLITKNKFTLLVFILSCEVILILFQLIKLYPMGASRHSFLFLPLWVMLISAGILFFKHNLSIKFISTIILFIAFIGVLKKYELLPENISNVSLASERHLLSVDSKELINILNNKTKVGDLVFFESPAFFANYPYLADSLIATNNKHKFFWNKRLIVNGPVVRGTESNNPTIEYNILRNELKLWETKLNIKFSDLNVYYVTLNAFDPSRWKKLFLNYSSNEIVQSIAGTPNQHIVQVNY